MFTRIPLAQVLFLSAILCAGCAGADPMADDSEDPGTGDLAESRVGVTQQPSVALFSSPFALSPVVSPAQAAGAGSCAPGLAPQASVALRNVLGQHMGEVILCEGPASNGTRPVQGVLVADQTDIALDITVEDIGVTPPVTVDQESCANCSILGGNQVFAPVSAPVNVCGIAVAIVGAASAACAGGAVIARSP
jgi:ChpA-C